MEEDEPPPQQQQQQQEKKMGKENQEPAIEDETEKGNDSSMEISMEESKADVPQQG